MSRAALPLILLAVATIYGLYRLSYAFEHLQHELGHYNHEILANRQEIAVLHVEWAYLSRPSEIARLTALYMTDLKPLSVKQIIQVGQIANLPARLPPPPTPIPAPVAVQPRAVLSAATTATTAKPAAPAVGAGTGLRLAERILGAKAAPSLLRPRHASLAGGGR